MFLILTRRSEGLRVGPNQDGHEDVDMLARETPNVGPPGGVSDIDIELADGDDVERMLEQEMKDVGPHDEAVAQRRRGGGHGDVRDVVGR
ncbi:hypothetical protein APHAL10511_003930 [Amanita phalloides]|nr:hypothetical protein APHAL10511_003930 [Amanita phalloides]